MGVAVKHPSAWRAPGGRVDVLLHRIDSGARRQLPDVGAIPVCSDPLPAIEGGGNFLARGTGPWQRKAKAMLPGQSLILTRPQAEVFRNACKRLGFKTASRRLDAERMQVQIVFKPLAFM